MNKFFKLKTINNKKNKICNKYSLQFINHMGLSGHFDTGLYQHKNDLFVLKIRKEKQQSTKQKFINEICFLKYLSTIKTRSFQSPSVIADEINKSPEWILYRFVEGKSAGWWLNFNQHFIQKNNKQLSNVLLEIQHLSPTNISLKNLDSKYIIKNFKNNHEILKKFLTPPEIELGLQTITNHSSLLEKTARVLSHGDPHPGNIILSLEKKIILIDWYNIHLNNQAFDATFIWFCLWNKPKIQQKIINYLLKKTTDKKEFKKLFEINQIILTAKFLQISNDIQQTKPTTENLLAQNFFIKNYKKNIKNYASK